MLSSKLPVYQGLFISLFVAHVQTERQGLDFLFLFPYLELDLLELYLQSTPSSQSGAKFDRHHLEPFILIPKDDVFKSEQKTFILSEWSSKTPLII